MKKVTIIGAGGVTFSQNFIRDFLLDESLRSNYEICLMDIDEGRLDVALQCADITAEALGAKYERSATTDLKEALKDSAFVMLVLFGTILSSIINHFLSTQGQISAVGTVVSSIYGFLCGAYMPLSSFPEGLQKVLSFLPGTYGTSLLRNHSMNGALKALENELPAEYSSSVNGARDAFDLNLYFFGEEVSEGVKFIILGVSIVVLITVYLLLNKFKRKKA